MTVDTDVTASASVLDCKSSPPPWRLFGSVFSRISRTRSARSSSGRASGGDAPEDARNYVEALRTEQEAQLPGWELARFVSRAHTAVGLPVVELARTGDKVVPAFSPATIERLGESYPDLHAAVRTMDPASPLAHPGPQDDPRYVAELNRALDGLRSSRGGGPGAVVDPIDALAVAAVVQERALAAPAREVPSPSLPGRPWEGPGSPGFDRRLQENVSALVAALDSAGVPVTFSKSVGEPIVEYTPDKTASGGPAPVAITAADLAAPVAKLVLPVSYAAPAVLEASSVSSRGREVSVADHASDGLPVLATDRLSSDELRTVFSAVALALPAALRDQPYPEELAKVREVVYTHAGDDAGRLYEREAEHFAGRLEARVSESAAYPPKEEWTPPAALVSQAAVVDVICARMAAAGAEALQLMAGDVARDASRAVATRDAACERLQDVVVPALRDAGVPVRIDPQSTVSHYVPDPRPARAQTGPAQDAVVISGDAVRTDLPTRALVAKQAEALAALGLALGQRGRADRPEARKVASEVAGRTSCPAPARAREGAACAHFANRQLADLWPARIALPAPPRAAVSVKVAAGEARSWVAGAVAAREARVDAALATPSDAPRSGSGPAPVGLRTAPVPVRPAPVPAPVPPVPGRAVAR